MTTLPHDVTDLYLAPVVLALDARIDELGALTLKQLADRVALESDLPDFTLELRRDGLLRTVAHLIECHGWELSWSARGIMITHGDHHLVLGAPATFHRFLAG